MQEPVVKITQVANLNLTHKSKKRWYNDRNVLNLIYLYNMASYFTYRTVVNSGNVDIDRYSQEFETLA